jgi:hypothetical protein
MGAQTQCENLAMMACWSRGIFRCFGQNCALGASSGRFHPVVPLGDGLELVLAVVFEKVPAFSGGSRIWNDDWSPSS